MNRGLKYSLIFIFIFNIQALKIDRAILSWDNNPEFNHFWTIASKAWKKFIGVKPTLVFIGNKNVKLDTRFGEVLYFEPIANIPTSFQAMAIRQLIPALYPNDYCILSDLDALPIDRKYFYDAIKDLPNNKFAVFYPNPSFYENKFFPPRYLMWYNVAKGSTFSDVFNVKNLADIRNLLTAWYNTYYKFYNYTTDERMLFKYLNEWKEKNKRLVLLDVPFKRLNREKWQYSLESITNKEFADAHLLRPYIKHKKEIDALLNALRL